MLNVNETASQRDIIPANMPFNEIDAYSTADDIKAILRKLDDVKKLLQMADKFRSESIRYAQMEAETIVKIVETGNAKLLRGYRRKAAEWLATLSDAERQIVIGQCSDGMLIEQIYKRDVYDVQMMGRIIESAKEEEKDIISTVEKDGIVDITEYVESVHRSLGFDNKNLANDMIDGVRNRLRRAGAVGIGNNSHVYVMPKAENKDLVIEAIVQRFESAKDDIYNMVVIAKKADIKIEWQKLIPDVAFCDGEDMPLVHMLFGLCSTGVIANEDEYMQAVHKSDVYKQMGFYKKYAISRVEALRIMLKNAEKEAENAQ